MYTLLVRVENGLDPLKEIYEKHVKEIGLRAIHENAKQAFMVCFTFR